MTDLLPPRWHLGSNKIGERDDRGIALVKLRSPPAHIILDALWRRDNEPPTVRRFIDTARRVSTEHAWL